MYTFNMSRKIKCTVLDLETKTEIIERLKAKESQAKLALKYDVRSSTIF